MRVREVSCKQALVPSSLPGLDLALNPYRGCAHGCAYCYAPSVLRETREWGTFVDVRSDMPAILNKDLRGRREGVVGVGTVTDPYQPVEARFHITRACLTRLIGSPLRVSIQTKSSLILRDLDILTKFDNVDVGVTVTTLDRYVARAVEPLASPPRSRIETIGTLADEGIDVWAFVGPYLPGLRGGKIETLVREVRDAGATKIMGDRLRVRPGVLDRMKRAAMNMVPDDRTAFLADLDDATYAGDVDKEMRSLCAKLGIDFEPAFPPEDEGGSSRRKPCSF